ncbi:Predicted nucleotidyltransferases [uncultured Blautia sp.]|jgi:predicted nucleotidyltransferase|nr:Predicted nucleotidyltransferases [uncultured Blautia sp.]
MDSGGFDGYNRGNKEVVSVIYTQDQIRQMIAPIAEKYHLKAVFLFGSYARGDANESSDVDLLVDTTGTSLKSLLSLGALYCDLEAALGKPIDLVTVSTLEQKAQMPSEAQFRETVIRERVNIYDAA